MSVMVEMTKEDANSLDEVVHELSIEDSFTTPAEAVRKLKAEIERLQPSDEHYRRCTHCGFIVDTRWKAEFR